MMIDSAFISVFTLANAIAELHIRDGNQKEGNRNCHENNVSHVRFLQSGFPSDRGVRYGVQVAIVAANVHAD